MTGRLDESTLTSPRRLDQNPVDCLVAATARRKPLSVAKSDLGPARAGGGLIDSGLRAATSGVWHPTLLLSEPNLALDSEPPVWQDGLSSCPILAPRESL